jgi:hypothetical protein
VSTGSHCDLPFPPFFLALVIFPETAEELHQTAQENKGLGCLFPLVFSPVFLFLLLNTTAKEELNNLAQLISSVPDVSFMEAPFPTLVPLYSTSLAGVPWPAT